MKSLKNEIMEIAKSYDWLVVDDYLTRNPWVCGSNADYDNINKGGGKAAIISTQEILQDKVILRHYHGFNPGREEYYVDVDELVQLILDYWA